MRIGLLVGACGLALTGVAQAENPRTTTDAKPTLQNEFTAKRDAVVGVKNSRLRKELENDIRQMLREGRIDPRRVTFADVIDEVVVGEGMNLKSPGNYGSPNAASNGSRAGIPGNPNPWASDLDLTVNGDFLESFETYDKHNALDPPTEWFELAGQVAPNGNVWGAAADYNGVVDNDLAQGGDNWDPAGVGQNQHGVVGGPDPAGERSAFFTSPRGSISTQPELTGNFFQARLNHALFAPTANTPVITVADYYLDSIDTFVWWRPVSFTEGFIVTNVFLGGFDFQYFGPFVNNQNIADRFIILGPKPGSFSEGEFFGAADPHRIQTQEWINVALRQAADSFSVWVRDSTTDTALGAPDDFGFQDTSGISDTDGIDWDGNANPGEGPFAGEIFETGWLQFFPGVEDDIDTPVIEGNGTSFNLFNQSPTILTDGSGSPAAPTLFSFGVDALQGISGSDPDQTTIPGFQPDDYYFDNYTVIGERFPLPDPIPDFKIPFTDDIELWNIGPLGLQNDQWFDNAQAEIADDRSNSGDQSVRQTAVQADNVMRLQFTRDTPIAVADTSTPVVFSIQIRRSDTAMTRGIFLDDNTQANDFQARVIMGGRDSNFIVDNRVYVRLPNPDFDPTVPQDDVSGINVIHNPGDNVQFLNVPLVDGGGVPLSTPTNTFFELRVETIDDGTGVGAQSIFVNGDEGFLDESDLGLTTPIGALTTPSLGFDQVEAWSGNELNGLLNQIWLDDYSITGPKQLVPTPLTVPNAPYTDDPAFTLPYSDGFETYDVNRGVGGQGATPWLGGLFTDTNAQLDIIPTVDPVDASTLGYYYVIDEELTGTIPGGVTAGQTVFVVDNIAPALPPNPDPVPGASDGATTRAKFRDSNEVLLAQADWILQDNDADPETPIEASPWDETTPVVGRYWYTFVTRWGSTVGEELLITDGTNFPANGNLVSLINSFASADAGTGDLDGFFTSLLPEARPGPGETAELSFDLWIGIDDPAVGPRSRIAWSIFGPGAQAGEIATIIFGGPNNFLDENSFDTDTGVVNPGPDGLPDNFFEGEPETPGGPPTFSDTTLLYQQVPNPAGGLGGAPDFLLEQTAYSVPGNTWIRCTAEIQSDGSYIISLDDGVNPVFTLSADALEGPNGTNEGDVQGTDGLFLQSGFDDGADGLTPTEPIMWNTLGASAAPEGGTAPLTNDATIQGSFNEVTNPTYFYFEIFEVDAGGVNLPTITEVDPAAGTIVGPRDIAQGDFIALWNNKQTAETAGANEVFSEVIPRNGRFWISSDGGATIDVRGDWIPLGLPGDAGINDPAPLGGMTNLAPPYNNSVPFVSLLQGSIVTFPDPPSTIPAAAWFVDNVFMDITGCFGDFTGDGQIDGGDLGILLGNWDGAGATDLNGDGNTDGADLGLLLGVWGPCP